MAQVEVVQHHDIDVKPNSNQLGAKPAGREDDKEAEDEPAQEGRCYGEVPTPEGPKEQIDAQWCRALYSGFLQKAATIVMPFPCNLSAGFSRLKGMRLNNFKSTTLACAIGAIDFIF